MKKLLLSIILLANAFAVFAQTPTAANHNVGCSADAGQSGGDAITNASNIKTILPAGDRTSTVSGLNQQNWGIQSVSTANDNANHQIYKFSTSQDSQAGGFGFSYTDLVQSNYIHVAVYAETSGEKVSVRLATSGGGNGTYNQYQVDSPYQPLNQGWNYLNIPLGSFSYADGVNDNFNFKVNDVFQVGFTFSTGGGNHDFYVDDIYFYTIPIVAANHNLGCSASTGDGSDEVKGITKVNEILKAGNKGDNLKTLESQVWDGASYFTSFNDNSSTQGDNHYKFIPKGNYGNGGLYFDPAIDATNVNTYLHAALYVDAETHVQVRLATPGGHSNDTENTYPQYQVNTTQLDLKPGWNYLNLPIDVREEDRQITNNQEGFAYWDCNNTFHFDKSNIHQVGFVVTEANHSLYIDDIYFYQLTYTTTDDDGENIDWNTATGTTCQVKRVFQPTDEPTEEAQNQISYACDHDNATYYGVSTVESQKHKTEDDAYYFVAELINPITVSDVEMIWGNGYPMHYEVYCLKNAPSDWSTASVKAALNVNNKLFTHDNQVVSYEPYYNTSSELNTAGFQGGKTRYVVVKMWEPMGNTFGFKLDEIHVGAWDSEYDTPDHLSASDLNFSTEKYNQVPLIPTVRNKRNAILTNRKITAVTYTVENGNNRYVNIDRDGDQPNVWATKPGNYVIDIDGAVEGEILKNTGKVKLDVNRDWRGKLTNTKSMIQDIQNANDFSSTSTQANTTTENFDIKNIKDDNLSTRWSSGSDSISAKNQYITIKLSDDNQEYQVRDLEFVWERAYPGTYAVYGFNAEPNITNNNGGEGTTNYTYDEFKTNNRGRLLYETTLPAGRDYFPYRDLHESGTDTDNGEVNPSLYDSKYLVVAFKNPVQQLNGDKYGVSLWELYGQAINMTQLNKLTKIFVADKTMYIDSRDNFTVQAIDETANPADTVVSKLNDVTFTTAAASGKALATSKVETTTDANGATIYNLYATIDGKEEKVAEIWDAGNNTYYVRTDSAKIIGSKTYNITAKYHKNLDNKDYIAVFALTIIKKPMDLLPTSTPTNLVFNDGYYVEERLEKYASPKVLTVNLLNVDFTTDYNGNSLSNVEIKAPRHLNKELKNGKWTKKTGQIITQVGIDLNGKVLNDTTIDAVRQEMNPNAVYKVNQNAFDADGNLLDKAHRIHGENVALKDKSSTAESNVWYFDELRVYDGYDFAPEARINNTIKAHNAFFYTNIPAKKKTTLVIPFDIRSNELNGIKFYTPTSLKLDNSKNEGTLTLAEKTGDTRKGNTAYIVESETNKTSATGGYALVFVSPSYGKDGETVEVSSRGSNQELPIEGSEEKATLMNSLLRIDLADSDVDKDNYYTYSAATEAFRPAGDDSFDYITNPETADKTWSGKDLRYVILPFYSCLYIPSSAKPETNSLAKISFVIGGGETTGINDIHSNDENALDTNAPMYDVMGRRVNKAYHGIVIQNGKKFILR